jgi:cytochrome P450
MSDKRTGVGDQPLPTNARALATNLSDINLLDPALLEHPYDLWTRLRREAPVWPVPGTRVFMVTSFDLVMDALGRPEDFSSNLTGVLVKGADGQPTLMEFPPAVIASAAIATADPPDHTWHRKLSLPPLSLQAVARLEPRVIETVDRLLDPLIARRGGNFMTCVAARLPALAVCWVLGLPEADIDKIIKWGVQGGDLLNGTRTVEEIVAILPETAALSAYLGMRLAEAGPDTPGLLGHLAQALSAGECDSVTGRNILVTMVGAAVETTMSLIGNTLRLMVVTPGLEARLRADPKLIPALIEESARLESPFRGHYRVVRRDCALGGVALRTGDRLQLMWGSANRDGAAIADPDALDLDRPNPRRHLAFGHGLHFCVGAALARMEVRAIIERVLARTQHVAMGPGGSALVPSLFVRRLDRLDLVLEV